MYIICLSYLSRYTVYLTYMEMALMCKFDPTTRRVPPQSYPPVHLRVNNENDWIKRQGKIQNGLNV